MSTNTEFRWLQGILSVSLVVASIIGLALASALRAEPTGASRAAFNQDGELIRPQGYREWIYVGAPVTPNDLNNGAAAFPEFHNVYIDPDSWAHYKKTGEFRDGTLIVKELISVGSKAAASGNGYFMGEYLGLEATIKDSGRFPDEPGNWAYFSFSTAEHKKLTETAAAFPTASCAACHQASAAQDMVFTQYYPILRAVREAGEAGTGGRQSTLSN